MSILHLFYFINIYDTANLYVQGRGIALNDIIVKNITILFWSTYIHMILKLLRLKHKFTDIF